MPRKFSSYLIRWWRGDSERLEVEHIQSGRKRLATSIEEALAWLTDRENEDAHTDAPEHDTSAEKDRE